MKEIFKDIEGYNGDYQVSNLGRIKSLKFGKEKILEFGISNRGYFYINLSKNGKVKPKFIHVLLFETFNDYKLKENECVHHKDKNKRNNHIDNFQLMTKSEHVSLHHKGKITSEKTKNLMIKKQTGYAHQNSILTEEKVTEIWKHINESVLSQRKISKMFNISQPTISMIKTGKIWKHIKGVDEN